MKKMNLVEKAIVLGFEYGKPYADNLMLLLDKNEREIRLREVSELIFESDFDGDKIEISSNIIMLQNIGKEAVNTKGFIFHDFKNGDFLAIDAEYKIKLYFKDNDHDYRIINNFQNVIVGTKPQRLFHHNGEKVFVGDVEKIITMFNKVMNSKNSYVDTILKEYIKNDIFIDGRDIYVPSELKYAKDISLFLSVRNPILFKKMLTTYTVHKDTGITLDMLKKRKKDIVDMAGRYCAKEHKTKLNIQETETTFVINKVTRFGVRKEYTPFNIFSI